MLHLEPTATGTMTPESPFPRKHLKAAVSAILLETGFNSVGENALETLVEMMQSFLRELTRSAKALSEFASRTDPIPPDIILALVEMGQNVNSLVTYGRRPNKICPPFPLPPQPVSDQKRLQLGTQPPRPSYIPEHLPEFPDAHSFIRTQTHAAPPSGYQVIRERAAAQKREVTRGLTRFIATTGDTENLFPDDPYEFPLIANKPKPMPYLESLLTKNPDDDDVQKEGEDDKMTHRHHQQQQAQDVKNKLLDSQRRAEKSDLMGGGPTAGANHKLEVSGGIGALEGGMVDTDSQIDNPYLRPIKMPRLKTTSKKSKF